MGAGSSTVTPPPSIPSIDNALTLSVCSAIERVVASEEGYMRELHDFAIARMEVDAAAAIQDITSSSSSRSRMAAQRSAALKSTMHDRLLNDFLSPNARFHSRMRMELAAPSYSGTMAVAQRRQSPSPSAKQMNNTLTLPPSPSNQIQTASTTSASAASAPSVTQISPTTPPHLSIPPIHSSPSALLTLPPTPPSPTSPSTSAAHMFASLTPIEQQRAIRSGVECEVERVWVELDMQKHYDEMSVKQSYAQKEAALQRELCKTFDELEF
jgi:hypothetical protein